MKIVPVFFLLLLYFGLPGSGQIYEDKSIERQADSLLYLMTLEEKVHLLIIASDTLVAGSKSVGHIGFMNINDSPRQSAENYNRMVNYIRKHSRFGIIGPRAGEALCAVMGRGGTLFPMPIALASSWDTAVVGRMVRVIGAEARSRGIRNVFAPVLNVGRDPRWGRTGETFGEDPWLISQMGLAYVNAAHQMGLITTLKHFAGNTGHEGMFGAPVFYSERYYREFEFLPYEICIREGKADAVMMSYNTTDGVPFIYNSWFMTEVLRKEWGFNGFIMTDGGGMRLVMEYFGTDTSTVELTAKCINAGCDMALDSYSFYSTALLEAVKRGLVTEQTVNESAGRILRMILRSGINDNPYTDPNDAEAINDCSEHRNESFETNKKCLVLLKNERNTLPFNKTVKRVAVLGPMADRFLLSHYAGFGRELTTVLKGIQDYLPHSQVEYVPATGIEFTYYPAIERQRVSATLGKKNYDGFKAEYYANSTLSGLPVKTKIDPKIDFDWGDNAPHGLDPDNFSVRWTATLHAPYSGWYTIGENCDDGVRLYIDDQLIIDAWKPVNSLFIKHGRVYLEKGKAHTIKVEYAERGGRALAKIGWDGDAFAGIPLAVETAARADVVIVVAGMFDTENGDRACLDLDEAQEKLILEVAKLNKPMAVVLQTANIITMNRWADKVPAILEAWTPGEEGGAVIARALFGEINPGGKLPVTIPKVTGQVPINYNRFPGRVDKNDVYWDYGNEPQFPFGHGLSYTSFEYSNLRVSPVQFGSTDTIRFTFDLTNSGTVTGDEVVQLYVHDQIASISRPVKELKSFRRVSLDAGQTQTVTLQLAASQLQFYDRNMKRIFEPGDFDVMIGSSSLDIRLRTTITGI